MAQGDNPRKPGYCYAENLPFAAKRWVVETLELQPDLRQLVDIIESTTCCKRK